MLVPRAAWKTVKRDGEPLLKVCCPACGIWGDLADHSISEDGTVSPSLICGNSPCKFHEHVRLEGWKP
jgi:hypothetical protein